MRYFVRLQDKKSAKRLFYRSLNTRDPAEPPFPTGKKKDLHEAGLTSWTLTDSNRRPSACKADALNQLS